MGLVEGGAGYTMVARATHCFPMQRESPVSSSDGVTTGSKPADAIDRGEELGGIRRVLSTETSSLMNK